MRVRSGAPAMPIQGYATQDDAGVAFFLRRERAAVFGIERSQNGPMGLPPLMIREHADVNAGGGDGDGVRG